MISSPSLAAYRHADAVHPDPALQDKLQALYRLRAHGAGDDINIRPPYLALLAALGNPHHHLPPVVHIAGTNGKGSTLAYIRAACEAAGYKVHAYTSPHLIRFNERIMLAGQAISDSALEALLDEAVAANNGGDGTFFEVTTAMAFAAFARNKADILLLETGMGGRLDCTNVVDAPLATIITTIGYDHMEFLGHTLPAIASEKAGIMKPGAPCIIAQQDHPDQVMPIFIKTAQHKGCQLYRHGVDWRTAVHDQVMTMQLEPALTSQQPDLPPLPQPLPLPCLTGAHQINNAAAALMTLRLLAGKGFDRIDEAACAEGLRRAQWPARLQLLSPTPGWPPGWELWLDGGHNENAARILGAQAAHWQQSDDKKLHLIIGMKSTKDPAGFLTPLAPYAKSFTFTTIGPEKSIDLNELAAAAVHLGAQRVHIEPALNRALAHVRTQNSAAETGRVLIAGSLYLAGEALKIHNL